MHALPLLTFPFITEHEKLFFTILLLGLCSGATGTTAGHRATLLAYAGPILGVMCVAWAFGQNDSDQIWLELATSLLIAAYGATLMGLAKATHATFLESWTIREIEHDLNQQLQHALEQAQQANQAKIRFLAAASHDLRQPLHTQSMLIATLSLRPLDQRSAEIVNLLSTSNNSLAKLLDGLLNVSKLDAGIIQPEPKLFQIRQLIWQHYAEIEGLVREKGLCPILLGDTHAVVNTDPELFLRILRNLTDNAIKFTQQGQIGIELHTTEDFVDITVSDTGPGILPEHQDKIFQEFYQIENSERDRTKGLGLGLSIVKRLTQLLNIQLSFTSSPHIGSQFTLRLPSQLPTEHIPPMHTAEKQQAASFALTVLIVDDEKDVRTSVRIVLEELGCQCLEAASTKEALLLLQHTKADFILADFRLRNGDSGIIAITAIQKKWPEIPAILVSGDTEPARQREAHDAGIRLLHKPLSLEQLKQELSDVSIKK